MEGNYLAGSIFIYFLEQRLNFEINYKQLIERDLYVLSENEFKYFIYFRSDFECVVNSVCVLQFCLFFSSQFDRICLQTYLSLKGQLFSTPGVDVQFDNVITY